MDMLLSAVDTSHGQYNEIQHDTDDQDELTDARNTESGAAPSANEPGSYELWDKTPRPRGRQARDPHAEYIRFDCKDVDELETYLAEYLQAPTAPAEHATIEFHFPVTAAFMVYTRDFKRTADTTWTAADVTDIMRRTAVSVVEVLQPTENPKEQIIRQKAVARTIVEAIQRADGFRYSFHNNWLSREDKAHRFSFFCNDSTLNKGRAANGGAGTEGRMRKKPVYDCKGLIAIKFSITKNNLEVHYRHVPLHKTYEERAPPPRKESKRRRLLEVLDPVAAKKLDVRKRKAEERERRAKEKKKLGRPKKSLNPRSAPLIARPENRDEGLQPLIDFLGSAERQTPISGANGTAQPVGSDDDGHDGGVIMVDDDDVEAEDDSEAQDSTPLVFPAEKLKDLHSIEPRPPKRPKMWGPVLPGMIEGSLQSGNIRWGEAQTPSRAAAKQAEKKQKEKAKEAKKKGIQQGNKSDNFAGLADVTAAPLSEFEALKQQLQATQDRLQKLEEERRQPYPPYPSYPHPYGYPPYPYPPPPHAYYPPPPPPPPQQHSQNLQQPPTEPQQPASFRYYQPPEPQTRSLSQRAPQSLYPGGPPHPNARTAVSPPPSSTSATQTAPQETSEVMEVPQIPQPRQYEADSTTTPHQASVQVEANRQGIGLQGPDLSAKGAEPMSHGTQSEAAPTSYVARSGTEPQARSSEVREQQHDDRPTFRPTNLVEAPPACVITPSTHSVRAPAGSPTNGFHGTVATRPPVPGPPTMGILRPTKNDASFHVHTNTFSVKPNSATQQPLGGVLKLVRAPATPAAEQNFNNEEEARMKSFFDNALAAMTAPSPNTGKSPNSVRLAAQGTGGATFQVANPESAARKPIQTAPSSTPSNVGQNPPSQPAWNEYHQGRLPSSQFPYPHHPYTYQYPLPVSGLPAQQQTQASATAQATKPTSQAYGASWLTYPPPPPAPQPVLKKRPPVGYDALRAEMIARAQSAQPTPTAASSDTPPSNQTGQGGPVLPSGPGTAQAKLALAKKLHVDTNLVDPSDSGDSTNEQPRTSNGTLMRRLSAVTVSSSASDESAQS